MLMERRYLISIQLSDYDYSIEPDYNNEEKLTNMASTTHNF